MHNWLHASAFAAVPATAHWGIPDPVEATGNEAQIRLAFADAMRMLANRIDIFVSLPMRPRNPISCAFTR